MPASLEEICNLAEHLLKSKHLVMVLGMDKDCVHDVAGSDSDLVTGAGVSKAAGIQPFRGSGGLLRASFKTQNPLDLFDKDTFQVWGQLALM